MKLFCKKKLGKIPIGSEITAFFLMFGIDTDVHTFRISRAFLSSEKKLVIAHHLLRTD